MTFRPIHETQQALGTFQDEMNRLIERVWHGGLCMPPFDGQQWAPPIDLYEFEERFVIYADVPGVDANSIDVSHVGSTVTLRGERIAAEQAGGATASLRSERRFGTFCRSVNLPTAIDPDRIEACFSGGVLEITIPKSASSRPRSVKVQLDEG